MTFEILASGSKGNVTAVRSKENLLLLDSGKPFTWTIERLNYKLPNAILITHEHGDHSYSVKNFLQRGVEMYMTGGTAEALKLGDRYNLHRIKIGDKFKAAGVEVEAIESFHDAAEPANFILQDATDRLLFITDTGAIPTVDGNFTKILIEANYSAQVLMSSPIGFCQRERIFNNHLSIETTEQFLKNYPQAKVELLHISKRHGDEDWFRARIRRF